MKNIVFARIDERLLHGQVVMSWVTYSGCNTIYVVDDFAAKNALISSLYRKLAPIGTTCDVLSVEAATKMLTGEPADADEKVLLLVKIPQVLEELVKGKVELKEINLGGMGLNKTRKPFIENVSANPEEIASMERMIDNGIHVFYQMSPYSKPVDVKNVIKKLK